MPKVWNIKDMIFPSTAIYCGRGTKYGNKFIVGVHGDRNFCCDAFEKDVLPTLDVSDLRGVDLVCHCKPKRCHCDAILKKANA